MSSAAAACDEITQKGVLLPVPLPLPMTVLLPVYICNNYDNVSAPKWFTWLVALWGESFFGGVLRIAYTQRVPCVPSETFCRPVKNFFFFFWPSLKQTNYALAARCRQGQG